MTLQDRNPELIELLRPDFQARYEANFALGMVHSSHMNFGAIRGYWPFSSVGSGTSVYDVSGQGRTLTGVSINNFNINALKTYVLLDGSADYYYRNDEVGLDITGTETYINSADRGFSYACWVSFDSAIAANEIIAAKWVTTTGNQRSWRIRRSTTGQLEFSITTDGSTIVTASSAAGLITQQATGTEPFQHIAVTYDPSTAMYAYINGEEVASLLVGVPASIWNSTAEFMIGALDGVANARQFAKMRTCHHVMSAMYLEPYVIKNLYEQTRALFGA